VTRMRSIATVLIRVAVVALTIAGFGLTGSQRTSQESPASEDVVNRDHVRQESIQVMVTDRNGHVTLVPAPSRRVIVTARAVGYYLSLENLPARALTINANAISAAAYVLAVVATQVSAR